MLVTCQQVGCSLVRLPSLGGLSSYERRPGAWPRKATNSVLNQGRLPGGGGADLSVKGRERAGLVPKGWSFAEQGKSMDLRLLGVEGCTRGNQITSKTQSLLLR